MNKDALKNIKSSKCDIFISQKHDEYVDEKKRAELKLLECIPAIRAYFEIKEIWTSSGIGRECSISYSSTWNYSDSGFEVIITLGPSDSIKDTFLCMRPFKYNSPVRFEKYSIDRESGLLKFYYTILNTKRNVEVHINVGKSQSCKRVKVGEKTIDIFETVCDDSQEDKIKEKLLDESNIIELIQGDDEIPF